MRSDAKMWAGLLLGCWGCLSTPTPGANDGGAIDAPLDARDAAVDVDAGPCRDGDGDGWPTGACVDLRFPDCDDGDDARHPGALESCGAGDDLDCDGAVLACADALDELETSVVETTGRLVAGGGLQLRLDPDHGHVMSELRLGASGDLLYGGTLLERFAGVHHWTHFHSVAPDSSSLAEIFAGPAAAQFAITWDDGPDGLAGTTTITVHADGRIHRREAFSYGGADITDSNYIVGYLALDQDRFTDYRYQLGGTQPVTQGVASVELDRWMCAFSEDDAYEVAWMATVPSGMPAAGARISSSGVYPQFAFQLDFARPGASEPDPGPYVGNFVVRPARFTADDVCELAEQTALAFAHPVGLTAAGEATVVTDAALDDDDDGDGEGDGFVDGAGWFALAAGGPGLRFAVEAALGDIAPPSSTFRIADAVADPPPVVTLGDQRLVHGRDYLLQPDVPGPGVLLLLAVPLADGDEVELVAAPGAP